MKNFIRNIKEHKKAALICLAVLILVIAAAVLAVKLSGGNEEPSEGSSSAEEQSSEAAESKSYFAESGYPVSVSERGQSLLISLKAGAKWEYSMDPAGIVSVDAETAETEENTVYALTPMRPGYTTVSFRQGGVLEGVEYDAVNIQAEITVYADESGTMHIRTEDMRMNSSAPGAADSKTPYLLSGSRVILPNGGDWTLTVEADGDIPEGLYTVMPGTDSEGRSYYDVSMDPSLVTKGGIDMNALSSRLLLKSESLGIEKRLRCVMNAEREWVLTEAEEQK